jgi:hypothetical protein
MKNPDAIMNAVTEARGTLVETSNPKTSKRLKGLPGSWGDSRTVLTQSAEWLKTTSRIAKPRTGPRFFEISILGGFATSRRR